AADAPFLEAPAEPYTNQASVDLVGTVPAAVVGGTDWRIRLYVAIGDGQPGAVTEVPVGASQHFLIPDVALSPGPNTFTASIVGATDLESEPSAAVTYVLDTAKPRIVITTPKDNGVVNGKTAKIAGSTQGRSVMSARNTATNATVNGAADGKGAFTLVIPLGTGSNPIEVSAPDPPGNVQTATTTLRRGTGALTPGRPASVSQIRVSRLPEPVTLY